MGEFFARAEIFVQLEAAFTTDNPRNSSFLTTHQQKKGLSDPKKVEKRFRGLTKRDSGPPEPCLSLHTCWTRSVTPRSVNSQNDWYWHGIL